MKLVPTTLEKTRFLRDIEPHLVGSSVTVERREGDWAFAFGPDFVIAVASLWRLIGASYVCVTSEDDGHQFGLPSPVDAAAKANDLLSRTIVETVEVDFCTGDLTLRFEGALTLEFVTDSSGYESWQMWHSGEFLAFGASGGRGFYDR